MIRVKEGINLLEMLANCGHSTYTLRKQGLIGEARIQKLRRGALPTWKELDLICMATAYNVGELIEYVDAPEDAHTSADGGADHNGREAKDHDQGKKQEA